MKQRILVLGSTGNVGQHLVPSLLAAGENVVAASRQAKSEPTSSHLQTVRLDLHDPSTFAPALENVDRVFIVAPAGYLASNLLLGPFLDVALSAPRRFVLQTAEGVQYNDEAPLRQLELRLEASGRPYVFLRPNWFMDNFHTFWRGPIEASGVIPVPAGDSRSAFIDALDIADAASAALRSERFDGQAFSLTGPQALSYAEAAAILSRELGRSISYQHVEDGVFTQSMIEAGLPADYSGFLALLFSFVRQGAASQVTDAVQQLTGHAPRTLEAYAQRNAGAFNWKRQA
jgi:uncharacterized protein YbjT (DUF2867 family)